MEVLASLVKIRNPGNAGSVLPLGTCYMVGAFVPASPIHLLKSAVIPNSMVLGGGAFGGLISQEEPHE